MSKLCYCNTSPCLYGVCKNYVDAEKSVVGGKCFCDIKCIIGIVSSVSVVQTMKEMVKCVQVYVSVWLSVGKCNWMSR